jgi:hypothetical protein
MVMMIILGSFVIGAIPLMYGSTTTTDSQQNPLIPAEAQLWRPLGYSE